MYALLDSKLDLRILKSCLNSNHQFLRFKKPFSMPIFRIRTLDKLTDESVSTSPLCLSPHRPHSNQAVKRNMVLTFPMLNDDKVCPEYFGRQKVEVVVVVSRSVQLNKNLM